MPLALARKYRPRKFAEVAVQSHVSATLQGAIARGRVAHGYLLCGPRGVGKTTLARVLAMALNCERPQDGEPCGECKSCERIWSGAASLDVVEIDAASNRGVDDARDLRERAMYAPSGDERYKVYIVDEAHMLTREAWNALLKILEEPPPRVVFVFATTEPQKIAQTAAPVLSRLQRFDFKRIGAADIRERLTHVLASELLQADPDALAMIARAADGSMRDALSLTDQVLASGDGHITAVRVRDALGLVAEDEFLAVLDIIADRRAADVFPFVARLADAGIDFGGFLTGLADILRAQLAVVLGGAVPDVSEHARRALEERRERFVAADLLRMLGALTALEPQFRKSGQQQLLVETLLVRLALIDRSIELESVIRGLGGVGDTGRAAREPAAPPGPPGAGAPRRSAPVDAAPRSEDDAPRSFGRPTLMSDSPAPRAHAQTTITAAKPSVSAVPSPVTVINPGVEAAVSPERRPTSLDLNRLVERWDELLERLRASGKTLAATALSHGRPSAVTGRGEVTIELEEPNEFYEQAFEKERAAVQAILAEWFAGVTRVQLKRSGTAAAPAKRLTSEDIRLEKLAALRKKDRVLGAAIDALDLDVVD